MASRSTICSPAEVLAYLGKASTATNDDMGLVQVLMPMTDAAIKTFLGYNVIEQTYTHLLPDIDLFALSFNDLGLPVDVVNGRISYAFPGTPVILQCPEIPVRSVTSLYADYSALGGQGPTDFPANTLQVQGTDYYVDYDYINTSPGGTQGISWTGHIRRWIGVWPSRQRCIKVTYTAGITADELDGLTSFGSQYVTDIKYAAIITTAAAFLEARATQVNGLGAQGPITSERLGDAAFQYAEAAVAQMTGMQTRMPWKAQLLLQPHRRVTR